VRQTTHGRLAAVAVFAANYQPMDPSVPAEILAADGSATEKTANPLAVPPLLSAVRKATRSRPYRHK
jgi:hypothetical protein